MAAPGSRDEVTIEKLVPGGEGLARRDGKVIFVPGVLPGERVRVEISERRRDYDRARLLSVLAPSPHRVEPPCALAGICGGCDWLHIDYGEQVRQKVALAADAYARLGGFRWEGLGMEAGPPLGYRNRLQVHRSRQALGFMARGSDRVVEVRACPVADPAFSEWLARGAPGAPAAPAGPKPVRHPVWAQGGAVRAEGNGEITVGILGKALRFGRDGFFQSNAAMLERLLPFALEGAGGGGLALDLYCGVGTFAAFLADLYPRLVCVEEDARALAQARINVGGGEGREFHARRLEDWLPLAPAPGTADLVVVDPPRPGLDRSVRAALAALRPERLVYVSCNPATQARDLRDLLASGYRLEALRLFDFYPQTSHVEAVARLVRGGDGPAG